MNFIGRKTRCECEINGEIVEYDGCSSGSLKAAKKFYSENEHVKWIHIGSGTKVYLDGYPWNSEGKLYHFFKKVHK